MKEEEYIHERKREREREIQAVKVGLPRQRVSVLEYRPLPHMAASILSLSLTLFFPFVHQNMYGIQLSNTQNSRFTSFIIYPYCKFLFIISDWNVFKSRMFIERWMKFFVFAKGLSYTWEMRVYNSSFLYLLL